MTISTLTLLTLALGGAASALILGRAFVDVIWHAFKSDAEDER